MAMIDGMEYAALHERNGILVAAGYVAGKCVFRWSNDGGETAQTIPGTVDTEVVVTDMDEQQPALLLTPSHQVLLVLTYGGALIIEEAERRAFPARTRFLALAWLSLSHALIEDTALWIWGHEHRMVIYDAFDPLKPGLGRARSIGRGVEGSAAAPLFPEVRIRHHEELAEDAYAYAIMELQGAGARVEYFIDTDEGKPLFEETIGAVALRAR